MSHFVGPIQPNNAGGPSRVIQGFFAGGRPTIRQASVAPEAPLRPQAPVARPIQARPAFAAVPGLPGRPAAGAVVPSLRPGQPIQPIVPNKLRPGGGALQPATPGRPPVSPPFLPQAVHPRSLVPQGPVVQRIGDGEAFQLPANLANFGGGGIGQPLPDPVRRKMESFFNTSFGDVRVHVGPQASSIGAMAFTHGSNLYFAPGQYNPNTDQGQHLLGHELTHVVQQRDGRVRNPFGSGLAVVQDRGLEAEAERMGKNAAAHVVAATAAVITAKKATAPISVTPPPAQLFASPPPSQAQAPTIQRQVTVSDFLSYHRQRQGESPVEYKSRVEAAYREFNDYPPRRRQIKELRGYAWSNVPTSVPLNVKLSGNESKHGVYSFTFGGAAAGTAFTLDDWSKATERPDGNLLFDPAVIFGDVYSAIEDWNCKKSIIFDVAKKVIVTTNGDTLATDDTWTISPFFATANRRRVAQVAMTAVQVLGIREAELPSMPTFVPDKTKNKVHHHVTPWAKVLAESRKKLKQKLLDRKPPPAKSEDITFVDKVAIADSVNANLIKLGYLMIDDGQIKQNSATTEVPRGKQKTFNFTVNHIRAMIFFDWVFVDDLLAGKLRKK
jgi:hypothetical protein